MNASFEEKSAWVTLAGLILAFVIYCWYAAGMLMAGTMEARAYLPLFLICGMVLVVFLVAGHVMAAVLETPEGSDERDQLIKWRADRGASWVLGPVVLLAALALSLPMEGAWVANGLLSGLFISEILRSALKAFFYRRGF